MALTDKLTNIGDAIRSKTGGTAKLTLDQMVAAINSISAGGGGADANVQVVTDGFACAAYSIYDDTKGAYPIDEYTEASAYCKTGGYILVETDGGSGYIESDGCTYFGNIYCVEVFRIDSTEAYIFVGYY